MKTRAQKEEAIVKLTEKLGRSKSVVFTDFRGMTMNQLSDLRNKLAMEDAEFSVTKNTLLDLSLKQSTNYEPIPTNSIRAGSSMENTIGTNLFRGPIATLFGFGDEIMPIKTLVKAIKDTQIGTIKGGFLNGQFLDADAITKLSALPSKLELQANLVGTLAAPLSGMLNVLQGNLRGLVCALDQLRLNRSQIRLQKGGE